MRKRTQSIAALFTSLDRISVKRETPDGAAGDEGIASAIKQIFTLKGRPNSNPRIVHLADAAIYPRLSSLVISSSIYRYSIQNLSKLR